MNWFSVRRPSAALVVSGIALVVALGGTSYAAFALPQNSVGTSQLRNGAVTDTKIKNSAVTKAKLNLAGVVAPSAINAKHAKRADNAARLEGLPGTAYLGSGALLHSGLVVLRPPNPALPPPTTVVLRNGPLSLTADCSASLDVVGHTKATLYANSTEPNWLADGIAQTTFSIVLATDTGNDGAESGVAKTFDLETPSGAVLRGQVTIAENWPDQADCTFDAYSVS
jgi:hypothetical protein